MTKKVLERIDKRYKARVLIALVELGNAPYLGKPLSGELKGKFSLTVWPYRIIYKIYKDRLIVYVIDIGPRGGAYK